MTRAAISNFPGKFCTGLVANMLPEQYRLHIIYTKAYSKHYRTINKKNVKKYKKNWEKCKKFKFVGPPKFHNAPKNVKKWNGPPKPKRKSTEYYRKKAQRGCNNLNDKYVKNCLCSMIPNLERKNITSELINLKRQQLKLWRISHEKENIA